MDGKPGLETILDEYLEERQYALTEKPAWLFVDAQRDSPLDYEEFNYFPDAHYRRAVHEAADRNVRGRIEPDGGKSELHKGSRKSTVYYWLDPDTGAALHHTEVFHNESDPFFGSEEQARRFLEQRADQESREQFEGMSLYKARVKKVEDALDVLSDQSGITDFMTDGGTLEPSFPRHAHQNYLDSHAGNGTPDDVLTYHEWLETELGEMWQRHGVPYF